MRRAFVAVLASLALGCVPDVDVDPSFVGPPRIVAVRAEPAEAAPGSTVTLTALDVSGEGTSADAELDWAACIARLPLAEPGAVARSCIAGDPESLVLAGTGISTSLTISSDACRLFGPDPPPSMPGQPNGRPVDPDSTGGYSQPVRIAMPDGAIALASIRLSCGVAGATQEQSVEVRRRYRANETPELASWSVLHGDGSSEEILEGVPLHVARSDDLRFTAAWPSCPTEDLCGDAICGVDEERASCADDCATPRGCTGAERYVRFDPGAHAVVEARESVRVSWLATLGTFAEPRTGRADDDLVSSTENTWAAPDMAAHGWIWAVVRDDRGGASWRSVEVEVDP